MTAQDQQSRAEFEAWARRACYEVERHDSGQYARNTTEQVWQSWQAARALSAPVICYVRPGATLPRRMGWETCAATDAGALAVHADGRAAPTGVEPVAWTVAGGVTNWARDFSKYKTQHYEQPVFTAAQVLAMGRVPPGCQPEPVAGQSRFTGEAVWTGCAPEHVRMVLAAPHEWEGYEVRYLYAAVPRPPVAQEGA